MSALGYDALKAVPPAYAVLVDEETQKSILADLKRMGVPVDSLNADARAAMIAAIATFPAVQLDTGDVSLLDIGRSAGAARVMATDSSRRGRAENSDNYTPPTSENAQDAEASRLKANDDIFLQQDEEIDFSTRKRRLKQKVATAIAPTILAAAAVEKITQEEASPAAIESLANDMVNAMEGFGSQYPQAFEAFVYPRAPHIQNMLAERLHSKTGGRMTALPLEENGIEDIGHLNHSVKRPEGLKVADDVLKGLAASLLVAVNQADGLEKVNIAPDKRTGVDPSMNMARLKNPN